jgi:hypothetical protein
MTLFKRSDPQTEFEIMAREKHISSLIRERDALREAAGEYDRWISSLEFPAPSYMEKFAKVRSLLPEGEPASQPKTNEGELESYRKLIQFIAHQPCGMDAEGSSENMDCSETGCCITEWCWPCHARAVLKTFKNETGVAPTPARTYEQGVEDGKAEMQDLLLKHIEKNINEEIEDPSESGKMALEILSGDISAKNHVPFEER